MVFLIAEGMTVRREMEINGCIEVPPEITIEAFSRDFLEWLEAKGWFFGGGICEIIDGCYINPDGTKKKPVSEA